MSEARETAEIWPDPGLTRVPFRLYQDADIYAAERAKLFQGPTWNFLALECEIPEPGDFKTTFVGDVPVIVVRDRDGRINAMENRCAHRGAELCLDARGNRRRFACVYHGWTYDLAGNLKGVAFQHGIQGAGGMGPDFRLEDHGLRKLRVGCFAGLVFASFADRLAPIEAYLGPEIAARVRRVLPRPIRVLGRHVQVLHNNWKLYVENVKDPYHASILHTFFTTFRINRLTQEGGILVDPTGGHHVSYSKIATGGPELAHEAAYEAEDLRADAAGFGLADPGLLRGRDEFGDGISLQILTIFPAFVLQQIQNSLVARQIVPRGVDRTEVVWTHYGFADDDDAMVALRARQSNLVGPAGYISMEDGAVGGFVQRAITGAGDRDSVVEMGGDGAQSQATRATESSIRGFWQAYRAVMEI